MGLTIHWSFQGPKLKSEAKGVIENLRQRAMDLPFESVGEIAPSKGEQAQALEIIWNKDKTRFWNCPAQEIIGFQIDVAPGSEGMEVFLATYPKSFLVEDKRTGKQKRLRTNLAAWSGRGFCKTQYASHPDCGGIANFLRSHLSVCRLLDYAKELGILKSVSDEGNFFENRDIPALVNTVADWNAFIAAGVGAFDDFVGVKGIAPIKAFPDFEHLEAKGQDQIDGLLRWIKERQRPEWSGRWLQTSSNQTNAKPTASAGSGRVGRNKSVTKKERQLFLAKTKELLLSLGAEQHEDDFVLQTNAGKLTLHPDSNDAIGLGTVFARFDDPDKAVQLVDCNRFSGKWNFHYFDGWTVETAIDDLSTRLKTVMG